MKNESTQPTYNILVIGANGGIGKQTIELALKAGHNVTALLRDPSKLSINHPNLETVKGDIMKPDTFGKYLENKDVVILAIGLAKDMPTTLYSEGNKNLLIAMKSHGVKRAFFISACAIEVSPIQPFYIRLATKYIVQKLFGNAYADQRIMERMIKESDINYTTVRPPRLNNKPVTGKYRYAANSFLKNCLSISRADVAHFMLNNISNEKLYRAVVEVAN